MQVTLSTYREKGRDCSLQMRRSTARIRTGHRRKHKETLRTTAYLTETGTGKRGSAGGGGKELILRSRAAPAAAREGFVERVGNTCGSWGSHPDSSVLWARCTNLFANVRFFFFFFLQFFCRRTLVFIQNYCFLLYEIFVSCFIKTTFQLKSY